MTTTCTQHEWKAPDGETFSYSFWAADLPPDQRPRAVVVAVHGLSGAALDYEPLARHLAKHGVVTFALELRGQGNDPVPARRGDLARIEDWFADLSAFFSLVRSRHPGAQIYYYGESMGAALLTRFLAQAGGERSARRPRARFARRCDARPNPPGGRNRSSAFFFGCGPPIGSMSASTPNGRTTIRRIGSRATRRIAAGLRPRRTRSSSSPSAFSSVSGT